MDPKDTRDEEEEAFLPASTYGSTETAAKKGTWRAYAARLRLFGELLLVISVIVLLVRPFPNSTGRAIKSSPVPDFPRKKHTFLENTRYLNEDMFADNRTTHLTLHNWVELSADARGYVQIENPELYDLPEPYTVAINRHKDGPAYMMSVFHQLHCLSYLVEKFQTGFAGAELSKEVAHHSAHCFDYLRQSIICSGDTTLEGKTEAGPGWGSEHVCADHEAVLKWANERGAMSWRNGLVPEEGNIL